MLRLDRSQKRTRRLLGLTITLAAGLAVVTVLRAEAPQDRGQQGPPAPTGPMAPEKYKDIQALTDVPADQLDVTMRYFAAATGLTCTGCHARDEATGSLVYEKDSARKTTARHMINLVKTVNAGDFGARINCGTCHQGRNQPAGLQPSQRLTDEQIATMAAQAAAQTSAQAARGTGAPGAPGAPGGGGNRGGAGGPGGGNQTPAPPVDDVLTKYVEALGGQPALAKLTSRVMTGTVVTRAKQSGPFTVEEQGAKFHYAVTGDPGPTTTGFDGTAGWTQAADRTSDLGGFQLQQALRMGDLGLPLHLKDRFTTVTASRPTRLAGTTPGTQGPAVNVLQGATPTLYLTEQFSFDATTGLLLRRRVVTRTGLNGSLTEQYDYADYRDVGGVKMPFSITHTNWNTLDTFTVSDIKINVPINASEFTKPGK